MIPDAERQSSAGPYEAPIASAKLRTPSRGAFVYGSVVNPALGRQARDGCISRNLALGSYPPRQGKHTVGPPNSLSGRTPSLSLPEFRPLRRSFFIPRRMQIKKLSLITIFLVSTALADWQVADPVSPTFTAPTGTPCSNNIIYSNAGIDYHGVVVNGFTAPFQCEEIIP